MPLKRILAIGVALALAGVAIAQTTGAPVETAIPAAAPEAATVMPAAEPAPTAVAALPAPGPAMPGNAERGEALSMTCAACHGVDGNSADPANPKLAGQHEDYTARQLALYQSGERDNAIMMAFAAPLSAQDMRDLGAFYAQQTPIPGVADETVIASGPNEGSRFYEVGKALYRSGDADRGIPSCAACHGPTGTGVPGPGWPKLAGQHAAYTALKLRAFRDGMVWGEDDRANTMMASIARNLTDEEIDSLASFLQGLHKVHDAPPAATAAR